mmetsp:Transcript_14665/g.21578  ORF Transcript_14665/g.21578 Transcript_14665/m.21578 type:complete len:150 (-) Transcript_14665:37-486(-)|eukprot:CAMPEP_0194029796 /NCGR_PEP_ID=MMETSP0009_2-20130614/3440_1 /TAXON_ID=210454 /ORGANISM="Grammatophora oceanica, Strain CCMP 410" /LENGTH=149 /DNA_ID=CAMNT_0038669571 /DNA_START=43 /DNA_END=492 /DNA_ORIENTATION=-
MAQTASMNSDCLSIGSCSTTRVSNGTSKKDVDMFMVDTNAATDRLSLVGQTFETIESEPSDVTMRSAAHGGSMKRSRDSGHGTGVGAGRGEQQFEVPRNRQPGMQLNEDQLHMASKRKKQDFRASNAKKNQVSTMAPPESIQAQNGRIK